MNTKSIFTIVAIVAAIGMLGITAVAIPSLLQAMQTKADFLTQMQVVIILNTATKLPVLAVHTAFS